MSRSVLKTTKEGVNQRGKLTLALGHRNGVKLRQMAKEELCDSPIHPRNKEERVSRLKAQAKVGVANRKINGNWYARVRYEDNNGKKAELLGAAFVYPRVV